MKTPNKIKVGSKVRVPDENGNMKVGTVVRIFPDSSCGYEVEYTTSACYCRYELKPVDKL